MNTTIREKKQRQVFFYICEMNTNHTQFISEGSDEQTNIRFELLVTIVLEP